MKVIKVIVLVVVYVGLAGLLQHAAAQSDSTIQRSDTSKTGTQPFTGGMSPQTQPVNGGCPSLSSIAISTSATTICPGTSVTFGISTKNGTFNGATPTYTWRVNGAVQSGSNAPGFVTSALTNGATVNCSLSLAKTGCTTVSAGSNTLTMTVPGTPVLTVPTGVTSICQGGVANFTTTSSDATSYAWSVTPASAGTFSGTGAVSGITFSSGYSGTATISVTGTVCSETSSVVSTTVTIVSKVGIPTAPAESGPICQGCAATYTTSAANATGYNWTVDGAAVSGSGASNTITFPIGIAPDATIGVSANGCGGPSAATTTVVTELLPGTIGPAYTVFTSGTTPGVLTGNAASGAAGGSYSYQWQSSTDGVNFSGLTGADSLDHLPAKLTATTWFRRQVTNGTTIGYSNVIEAQINTGTVPDRNFIRERTILKPGVPDTTTASGLTSIYDFSQSTQYFDGLGRPIQTVAMRQSPLQHDMVSFNMYDPFGREVNKYMSYTATTSDGNYKSTFQSDQDQFNTAQFPGQQFYFSETNFEPSPVNRPLAGYAPGTNWVGAQRGVGQQYLVNQPADSVQIWNISFTPETIPSDGGAYAAGALYKNVTTDENGNQVVEYKDKNNLIILKKVQVSTSPGTAHAGWLCTYYVYDNLNNLRFVIPPQAVALINSTWSISSTIANALCFRYEYDDRNRMSIKKIPGTSEVWMVYDARDRLVMSQDSNQRVLGKWLTTQYDAEDRPDSTGLLTDPNNRTYHQNLAANSTGYPSTTGGNYEWLTRTYYDNYNWVTAATSLLNYVADNAGTAQFITTYNTSPLYAQSIVVLYSTRGMVTGHMAKVIGTTNTYLYSNIFYDDHGREVQTQSINYSGGVDTLTTEYDFSGKPLRIKLDHKNHDNAGQDYLLVTKLSYDPGFRLKSISKNINNGPTDQLIDSMQYNELGQLRAKYLGNNLDSLIYDYNVRGWVTGINKAYVGSTANHYFGMELGYDNRSSVSGTTYAASQYNGNITGVIWKSMGDGISRKYDFTYDNANRLMAANFVQNPSSGTWNTAAMDYTLSGLSYDANGNILSMNQKGFKIGNPAGYIDQLTYSYQTNSNQLSKVVDAANDTASTLGDFHYKTKGAYDYTYDGNGNLHIDNNKGIDSIGYNYLNLPQYVHMKGKGTIVYTYDAGGTKWKKTTTDSLSRHSNTTLYLGSFVYQQNDSITNPNGGIDTLQFILHEEGRTRWVLHHYLGGTSAYGFEYDFYEKDHLGNTRVLLSQEKDTAQYIATMEPVNRATENALFYNIDSTSYATSAVPGGYPGGTAGGANDSVAMVSGSTGDHTQGPALILKVMAGDSVAFGVNSYYVGSGAAGTTSSSLSSVLSTLAGGLVALGAGGGESGTFSALNNSSSSPVLAALNSFLPSHDSTPASRPKAYLNWMLLDNQFNYVSGNGQSGAIPVGNPNVLNTLASSVKLNHSGYLYIWVSNETQNWMVFFDNLSIEHVSGPMVEENHYYPFGLTMAGISDKALKSNYAENKYRFNKGSELQNKEFSDGSGLEMYDTHFRQLDPQLGRWWQVDPKPDESTSPYSSMGNNPILRNDPLGDTLIFPGASEEFVEQFYNAFAYLDAHGRGDDLTTLQNSTQNISIVELPQEADVSADYVPNGNIIHWSPYVAETNGTVTVSPATVLDHEADHAVEAIAHPEQYAKDADPKTGADKQYGTKEERRVITGREQKTAKALGEIKSGQVTRTNHKNGQRTIVSGPTSTKSSAEQDIFDYLKSKQGLENSPPPQKPPELQHPGDAGPAGNLPPSGNQ